MIAGGDAPGTEPGTGPILGLLWNPSAGGHRRRPDLLERTLDALPIHAHRAAATPPEVSKALTDLAAHDVDVLVIGGGDGTIQAAMTSLFEERPFARLPAIVLLPGGTTNMDARDVGVRGDPVRALARLRRRAGNDLAGLTPIQRPVLRISHGQQCVYGFFFGTGLIAEGVDYFQKRIHRWTRLGELGALIATLRTLASLLVRRRDPIAMTLDWGDARPRRGGWALVLVTSLERVLFRLRPYHEVGHGAAHMTLARYPLRRALVALIRAKGAAVQDETSDLYSRRIDRIELSFDGEFAVDGELYRAERDDGPVSVTIADEPVRFLVPP